MEVSDAIPKVRINFWLTEKMHNELQYIADRDGRTLSDVLRESIRDFLKEHIKEGDKDGRSNS